MTYILHIIKSYVCESLDRPYYKHFMDHICWPHFVSMQSHQQRVDCQYLQPLYVVDLRCNVYYMTMFRWISYFWYSSSLAMQIYLQILYSWRRQAGSSFALAEIDSTVIGNRDWFLVISQNAWRLLVNVGTLSMSLAFNTPILHSTTDPSSSFIFFTQKCTIN